MKAFWITPKKVIDKNVVYRFTKDLNLKSGSEVELNVSADTRYRLYFNGEYVCEGPCQSDHWFWRYENVKIPTELVRDGSNKVTVDVLYISDEMYFTQAKRDRAALIVFGSSKTDGVAEDIYTNSSWGCKIIQSQVFINAAKTWNRVMANIPPMAAYTLDEDIDVGTMDYKRCWHDVGNHTPYGLGDDYRLAKREIKVFTPEKETPFKLIKQAADFTELDAGIYTTAFPKFTFKGEKGKKIRFIYTECYTDENGSKVGVRRDKPGAKIVGAFDEITFTGAMQTYESYFYKAFRYVRVEYPEGTEFVAENQFYKPYFYPVEGEGKVKFSDEAKNRIWDVSVNTLKCCTHETFVDCPYYEQCQYDMDTAIEMMVMMRLTDDYTMPKKAVYDLARSQQPDGMLCAHYPTSWVQIIPNFSLFWILMLRDYATYSGDVSAIKELMPVADKVLNAFELLKTEQGLVGSTPYWNYTDWVPGWERGVPPMGVSAPTTVSSMMYAYALGIAADLASEIGRNGLADEYLARKSEMIKAVNTHLYDAEKQFYVDTYGYKTYSEHTAVWAVLSDCVTGKEAGELLDRSFSMDVSRASFSFGYYTFRALEKADRYKKYSARLFEGWYKMLDMGCTTWCENPDDPRSECHAWSAAPVYEYSANVLGVKPTKTGFDEVVIEPDISADTKVSGAVPTPKGVISVSFETVGGKTSFSATVPSGIKATVKLNGKAAVIEGKTYTECF